MSPAAKQINPTSLRSRLRLFFATNPGEHRPRDIADTLGEPPRNVARELSRLHRDGALLRTRPEGAATSGPGALYSLAPPKQETETE